MTLHRHWLSYFFYFLLFNLCFLGLQTAFLYSQNNHFINSLDLPPIAWRQIMAAGIVHLFLYLFLSLVETWLLCGILRQPSRFSADRWQIIIWFLCAALILCANSYYFPLSAFSKLFSPPIPPRFFLYLFCVFAALLLVLFLRNLYFRPKWGALVAAFLIFLYAWSWPKKIPPALSLVKPNIIILGIDSLSPESVNAKDMPFFTQLIEDSTRFTQAISPLARTYPAWTSILTGLYVKHHHAEENLVAKSSVKSNLSIAWLLQQQGYHTIFATDDRRFNSIGNDFGFNEVIGPKIGVNDVLLGTFNDFPLSNLIINSRISAWLFPFNYSNRASFFSYYPQTFSSQLDAALDTIHNPVFLNIHFTLPHWPYAWAQSLPEQVNNEFSIDKRAFLYQQALQRVDQQFAELFTHLQQRQFFTNSLLIVLSDHGEALYYPNSRLTNKANYQGKTPSKFAQYLQEHTATALDKSAGHGSDLLSPKQYHCVLAFRIYKQGKLISPITKINSRVALIDLAPTILDFVHQAPMHMMDGISLLPAIFNPLNALPQRVFYLESGMFPNQLITRQKSIAIGKMLYAINPQNGELEIKPDQIKKVNAQKLYGVLAGDWILALYPDQDHYIAVIQNLVSGDWSDDLHGDFAQKSPAQTLQKDMHHFFGNKLIFPFP